MIHAQIKQQDISQMVAIALLMLTVNLEIVVIRFAQLTTTQQTIPARTKQPETFLKGATVYQILIVHQVFA